MNLYGVGKLLIGFLGLLVIVRRIEGMSDALAYLIYASEWVFRPGMPPELTSIDSGSVWYLGWSLVPCVMGVLIIAMRARITRWLVDPLPSEASSVCDSDLTAPVLAAMGSYFAVAGVAALGDARWRNPMFASDLEDTGAALTVGPALTVAAIGMTLLAGGILLSCRYRRRSV